jgi:hypothetical protein
MHDMHRTRTSFHSDMRTVRTAAIDKRNGLTSQEVLLKNLRLSTKAMTVFAFNSNQLRQGKGQFVPLLYSAPREFAFAFPKTE